VQQLPPGPHGHLFIGNGYQFIRDPLGFLESCAKQYGDVVRLRLGDGITYLLSHPAQIEYVLRGHHQNFIKGKATRALLSFVKDGLLVSEGDYWRRQRKLAQPAFQLQQVAFYGDLMVQRAAQMTERWTAGEARDIHADLMRLTMQIITKTVLDLDFHAEEVGIIGKSVEEFSAYSESLVGVPRALRWVPTPLAWRGKLAIRRLFQVIDAILARERQEDRAAEDLLSRLRRARDEQGRPMSLKQLRDETTTLILAGHETTALALSYACHLLSEHAEAQARLVGELQEVLGDRLPTATDLPRLRYAEWVVQEAMRLYPPAWIVSREAVSQCEIGGYLVPKGTQLFACQWIVHRDPRWFDEPEQFRPERWENDLAKHLPRCAYFPFGDGPRICIGSHFAMTEAILVLATILKQCQLLPIPGHSIELQPAVTLRPKGGIHLRVEPRLRTTQA
jgi:cytochrome P450